MSMQEEWRQMQEQAAIEAARAEAARQAALAAAQQAEIERRIQEALTRQSQRRYQ